MLQQIITVTKPQRAMTKVHWPPMNKFVCKLHGYIVYFFLSFTDQTTSDFKEQTGWYVCGRNELALYHLQLITRSCAKSQNEWALRK